RSAARRFAPWRCAYPAYQHHKKRAPWGAFACLAVDYFLTLFSRFSTCGTPLTEFAESTPF
ncbi:hypothetical protein ACVGXF_00180, partial [Enterobacter hormaechei]